MYRKYKFQHTFYETAFAVVHNILTGRVDLPKLLNAIKGGQKAADALKSVSGKELLEFFPPAIQEEIKEEASTTEAREDGNSAP
ncbi:MAG TPA: hypothetical protein VMV03_07455 [Spirochaetia bacterium]|nr:hypothetical protein [Spirochaetia bacterium]